MNGRFSLIAIAMAGALGSCGVPAPSLSLRSADCDAQFSSADVVRSPDVFFMASSMADCRKPELRFAPFRSNALSYGFVTPRGSNDEPWQTHEAKLLREEDWVETLVDQVNSLGEQQELLIFVHGYRNNFHDGLQRAVTVRNLYPYAVPTVSIVWPSRKRYLGYIYDASSIGWAQSHIDRLLRMLVHKVDNVTLVAHSMGSRALIGAVERLNLEDEGAAANIRKIILVSPDVDRDRVLREKGSVEALLHGGRSVTIYSSQEDFPLRTSRRLHGYSRLGSSDCRYSVNYEERDRGRYGECHLGPDLPGLSIVETSGAASGGFNRHSDVFDTCIGRADLKAVLTDEPTPWRERVEPRDGRTGYRLTQAAYDAERDDCPR